MKKLGFWSGVVFFASALVWSVHAQMIIPDVTPGAAAAPAAAPVFDANGPQAPIATVNGQRITRLQLEMAVRQMMAQQGPIPDDQRAAAAQAMAQQALQNLIGRELLAQEAGKQNIEISRADLDKAIEQVKGSLPAGQTLEAALKAQGTTLEQLQENLIRELRVARLIEQHTADVVAPTDAEIESFYNENATRFDVPESVKVRHVMVNILPTDSEEVKKLRKGKADSMRQQILDGRDFAQLAMVHSDDASRSKGGEVGPLFRGRVDPAFETAAFALAKDAVSPVVESRFGYHVIQGIEKTPAHRMTLDEVKDQILNALLQQRRQARVNEYVQQLSQGAKIDVMR